MSLINGLPAHVLLVHAVVVLVPLSALMLVICALWPQAARRLGLALPLLALVTLATVPLATQAGEWLERHVDSDPLVRRHAELGDGMLPWALGLFVLAAACVVDLPPYGCAAVAGAFRGSVGSAVVVGPPRRRGRPVRGGGRGCDRRRVPDRRLGREGSLARRILQDRHEAERRRLTDETGLPAPTSQPTAARPETLRPGRTRM